MKKSQQIREPLMPTVKWKITMMGKCEKNKPTRQNAFLQS